MNSKVPYRVARWICQAFPEVFVTRSAQIACRSIDLGCFSPINPEFDQAVSSSFRFLMSE